MTAEQFENGYAKRSGLTLEQLREYCVVRPCLCGLKGCQGWQSVSYEAAAEIDDPDKPWAR